MKYVDRYFSPTESNIVSKGEYAFLTGGLPSHPEYYTIDQGDNFGQCALVATNGLTFLENYIVEEDRNRVIHGYYSNLSFMQNGKYYSIAEKADIIGIGITPNLTMQTTFSGVVEHENGNQQQLEPEIVEEMFAMHNSLYMEVKQMQIAQFESQEQ